MATLTDPTVEAGDSTYRPLDVEYIPHASKTVYVSYTVQLSVTAPLLSSQSIECELMLRAPSSDQVPFASAYLDSTQGSGLSLLSLNTQSRQVLSAFVPPGWSVEMVTTGSGDCTFVNGQEATF